jgi:hypothetical protein
MAGTASDTLARLDHWSSSKFALWDRCPVTFRDRYVLGLAEPLSEPMRFGQALHQALEQYTLASNDRTVGDQAFRAAGTDHLALGWRLLELVYDLGFVGRPELPFTLDTSLVWGLPTVGIIDLVDPERRVVYDYKTSVGTWGQERADRDLWQPTLYQWAALEQFGDLFEFQYVVINRRTLEVATFSPSRSFEERFNEAYDGARMISQMVSDGAFPCAGGHGMCPECGERWEHDHVCDFSVAPPRIHIRPRELRLVP